MVVELADQLGLREFSMVGQSCGAIYAMVCALPSQPTSGELLASIHGGCRSAVKVRQWAICGTLRGSRSCFLFESSHWWGLLLVLKGLLWACSCNVAIGEAACYSDPASTLKDLRVSLTSV
jgi:hypothetical protein